MMEQTKRERERTMIMQNRRMATAALTAALMTAIATATASHWEQVMR